MISFQTAYLKAHYPIEFLLANLMHEVSSKTQDADSNIEKIKKERGTAWHIKDAAWRGDDPGDRASGDACGGEGTAQR